METHEIYVSIETAKLLKQAGFDWECRKIYYCYHEDGDKWELEDNHKNHLRILELDYCLLAPTLTVAQRWLREVKDINIYVCPGFEPLKEQWKMGWQNAAITSNIDNDDVFLSNPDDNFYDTYEKALEAGIKKALEIMLEKGE